MMQALAEAEEDEPAMTRRARIAVGMAAGLVWGGVLLGIGATAGWGLEAGQGLAFAAFPAGAVMILLIARLAALRFFDDALIDGQLFPPGSVPARMQAILQNTVEQSLLAALVWPLAAVALGARGGDVVMVLGLGFGMTRVLFWVGYVFSPPLRAFGFAGGFYPTIMVAAWAVFSLLR